MRQHERAILLLKKGCEDEALVEEVLNSRRISDEILGFHCQQAAEKFLKAVLSEVGAHFQRTHNLRQLMDLLSDAGHSLPDELHDIDILTPFGTTFRYDVPSTASSLDRRATREMIRRLRIWTQQHVEHDQ